MQRLAGFDAAFLALESPTNHLHVASLLIVDPAGVAGGWTFERVRHQVRSRLPLLPPFRRRLVRVPFGINHPLWTDVADVDLTFHVRRAALPRPGGPQELAEVVADLLGRPLDRTRPLWELHVIEGLADDLAAVLIKAHHCALDGVSGNELLARLLDREETPTALGLGLEEAEEEEEEANNPASDTRGPEVVPDDEEEAETNDPAPDASGRGVVPDEAEPTIESDPEPTEAELIGDAVAGLPGGDRLVSAVQRTLATVFSVRHRNMASSEPPPPSPFTAPRTSLNVRIGPWRRAAWVRLSLDDLKVVTATLGGTANDVVLALCSGALRSYLANRGEDPEGDLIALVPLSVRSRHERVALGNRVSPMLVSLATGTAGAVDRLRAITAGTTRALAQDRLVDRDLLAEWAELVVPALAAPAARLGSRLLVGGALPPAFNIIVSNVPGPRRPLFLAGARVTEMYPLGPVVDSIALNVTVTSYRNHLHVGVVADRDAGIDVDGIAGGVERALEELRKEAEETGGR